MIHSHLCNIINKELQNSSFTDTTKIASVRPPNKKVQKSRASFDFEYFF